MSICGSLHTVSLYGIIVVIVVVVGHGSRKPKIPSFCRTRCGEVGEGGTRGTGMRVLLKRGPCPSDLRERHSKMYVHIFNPTDFHRFTVASHENRTRTVARSIRATISAHKTAAYYYWPCHRLTTFPTDVYLFFPFIIVIITFCCYHNISVVVTSSLIVRRLLRVVYTVKRTVDIKNRPRIPIPDEDPYSIAGANMVAATREQLMMQTAARRGDKPPKLPPRDPSNPYPHDIPKVNTRNLNFKKPQSVNTLNLSIQLEINSYRSLTNRFFGREFTSRSYRKNRLHNFT